MTAAYDNASARANAALLAARLAHQRRAQSVDAYRQAIAEATYAGCTYTEIAATLGITRQAIRQLALTTGRRNSQTTAT
jgi:DNA-directed RNA polymerase specialized sigma24 family protein